MKSAMDLSGQRFGHLTVIQRSSRKNAKCQAFWVCKCDCGRFLTVRGDNLYSGKSRQCSMCCGSGKPSIYVEDVMTDGVV